MLKNLSFDNILKRLSDKKPKLAIYKLSEYVGRVDFDKNLFVRWEGPKVSRSEWDPGNHGSKGFCWHRLSSHISAFIFIPKYTESLWYSIAYINQNIYSSRANLWILQTAKDKYILWLKYQPLLLKFLYLWFLTL